MMNKKGLTAIELMAVMTIMGIVLTIAVINYRNLMVKANVESDTRRILTMVTSARQYSFTRKVQLHVAVDGKTVRIETEDGNLYEGLSFTGSTDFETEDDITFVSGFVTVTGTITSGGGSRAEYDCILFETNRIKAGRFVNGACDAR
ncbi:type II secretion system protein [Geovibrio thiophilus]|uniref:Type II secretion system protein n=1 Tax=Geovibrio thiophilus TaxID=139438 RepID=A0A3R6AWE4_9BACT|nr:type II secretion system protein [Geovibrio thiophilus]QAR32069.1 type II secretion system protein [Geovibrio thiophilus]